MMPVSDRRLEVDAAVLGAGSWGTVLARLLAENGHRVRLWCYEPDVVDQIRSHRENRTYLPGVEIPESVRVSDQLSDIVPDARLVVSASPSQFVSQVITEAAPFIHPDAVVVSASKGIENGTLHRMDEVLAQHLPSSLQERLVVISGPTFAVEVAEGRPTALVAASESEQARLMVQRALRSPTFRVYTSRDVVGVELAGALKNVIALAAGVAAGLELGANTQAALITRGLAEITRLGVAMGGDSATFYGLAGIGDLVLTCTGDLSRNRTVGVRLGRGESLTDILGGMSAVAEGVRTASAVHALAKRIGVEMPIVEQIHAVLEEGQSPLEAVKSLMMRDPKPES